MSLATLYAAARRRSSVPRRGITLTRIAVLALRELRSGLGGFYIFIACVALGVAVITTVGLLSDALKAGFERQGRSILGGDLTFARVHTRASAEERTWFDAEGRVSESATLRAMARTPNGEEQALIEIKAVDAGYPLVGTVATTGAQFADVISGDGAAVDPILLERLGLKIGDTMRIGGALVPVRATVGDEPDAIADRLTYGPRVFVSLATLDKTGLVQPGTLVRWRYAIALADNGLRPSDAETLLAVRDRAKAKFPEAGFSVSDRRDPSPQVTRTLDRLRQFLTFLGLTSLLVGGVGVASAVATFIERRRDVIATMKSIGATGRTVFALFLVQVLAIALIGVAIGLAVGLAVPPLLVALYGNALPIQAEISFSLGSIVTGVAYGILVALLFTLWPLGRAELVSASVLFRDEVAPERIWPRRRVIVATILTGAALFAFAVLMSDQRRIALYFCGGVVLVFGVFTLLGTLVTYLARRVPRPRIPEAALAIGNIGAPGGLTRSVVLSLGAGLSLLVAVALTNTSLVKELTTRLPTQSPAYFLLDVPKGDYDDVVAMTQGMIPGAHLVEAPMLRGRLIALKGKNVEDLKAPPEAQWVLNGDRGLTYGDEVPEGSALVKGDWWPKDYDGPPLVSFEAELAQHLGVGIGDEITVNVLGRNLTARIANLREVKWESLALNFVMVFSPNALRAAPHNLLATIALPKSAGLDAEVSLMRALGKAHPSITVIRVKDALDAFNAIFKKVMVAVRAAGAVTLLSGALVLAGALATAQRRRVMEAVVLKVLGATRRRILLAHLIEYVLLAATTALFAVGLGALTAWVGVTQLMHIDFSFDWGTVGEALAVATGLVAVFGLIGTWAVLSARPVPYLRAG